MTSKEEREGESQPGENKTPRDESFQGQRIPRKTKPTAADDASATFPAAKALSDGQTGADFAPGAGCQRPGKRAPLSCVFSSGVAWGEEQKQRQEQGRYQGNGDTCLQLMQNIPIAREKRLLIGRHISCLEGKGIFGSWKESG